MIIEKVKKIKGNYVYKFFQYANYAIIYNTVHSKHY